MGTFDIILQVSKPQVVDDHTFNGGVRHIAAGDVFTTFMTGREGGREGERGRERERGREDTKRLKSTSMHEWINQS